MLNLFFLFQVLFTMASSCLPGGGEGVTEVIVTDEDSSKKGYVNCFYFVMKLCLKVF
jgi:hypothetical protein